MLPQLQVALMVEEFGPAVLGSQPDFCELIQVSKILNVREMYRLAGTKQQKLLTGRQWEQIVALDRLAAEEATKEK